MDIAVIVGTRPEAIKCAPVIHALRAANLSTHVLSTGQHRELLHTALADFDLTADSDLALMRDEQTLPELTARLMEALPPALAKLAPKLVIVQGDTTTAFVGALAAYYGKLPCAHVEAGLRSGNRMAPWPEELNRRLADQLCTRHYAPTECAQTALLREGIDASSIMVTGQTGVDAALWMSRKLADNQPPDVAAIHLPAGLRLVYATGHRRESLTDGGLARVAAALADIAREFPDVAVVYPVHPNPAVQRQITQLLGLTRVHVIAPLSYAGSIWMMRNASVIVSDSGGIQEEAPSFGVRVLVTRGETERPEGVAAGFLRVVGTDKEAILGNLRETLRYPPQHLKGKANPYGDGKAGERIAKDVRKLLK
ncbi:MAG: UDP-N-acetylglucosamine 2-epimerase (non-hydrolyzing) [Planctomycetes bacterium]|nr:UDP-N-acetylglucosamine 2-epimerase (non-hydrolyzing) [Planctomycetota bacterium]